MSKTPQLQLSSEGAETEQKLSGANLDSKMLWMSWEGMECLCWADSPVRFASFKDKDF